MRNETIIGIQWGGGAHNEYSESEVALCSFASWRMLHCLMDFPVTYSQVLFPYADALSLSEKKGTESTRVFGTHLLLRNVSEEAVEKMLDSGREFLSELCYDSETDFPQRLAPQVTAFSLNEGSVCADDLAAFLQGECGEWQTVGDFSKMLSGFVPHWRIREAARVYASFTEIAYRQSRGAIAGLCGGRAVLRDGCGDALKDELEKLFYQKTGCR